MSSSHVSQCLLAVAVALLGCGPRELPFLVGAGTSAYQVEGGLHHSDWWQWEQLGHIDGGASADDGPDMLSHFPEDLELAQQLGHNAYRFSIDWSRVEPVEGHFDEDALAYYARLIRTCRLNGLTPVATLWHFTLPIWLHDVSQDDPEKRGFNEPTESPEKARIVTAFERYAALVAKRFGPVIDIWLTLNEPNVYATATYVNPTADKFPRPPDGESDLDLTSASRALAHLIYAHARAYDAIHANDTDDADGDGKAAIVGIAQHFRKFEPAADATDYVVAAKAIHHAFNEVFLDAIVRGDLDFTLDGEYDAPKEGTGLSDLAGRLDFVGMNYYSRSLVYPITLTALGPFGGGQVRLEGLAAETNSVPGPKTDLGWDIAPYGLRDLLLAAHQRYGLPLMVTENGMADDDDDMRPSFILQHVDAMREAQRGGAEVWGYLHWSLVDNFEWVHGYGPRFGLLRVDYDSPDRTRTVTQSALLLRNVALTFR